MNKYKGKLITIEGPDGIGKTTTINDFKALMNDNSKYYIYKDTNNDAKKWINLIKNRFDGIIYTNEPGDTKLGQEIRKIILNSNIKIDSNTRLMLFLADRAQHIQDVIKPALKQNKLVICDRFTFSTIVYQSNISNKVLDKDNLSNYEFDNIFKEMENVFTLSDNIQDGVYPDLIINFQASLDTLYNRLINRENNDHNDKKLINKTNLNRLINRFKLGNTFVSMVSDIVQEEPSLESSLQIYKDDFDILSAENERKDRLIDFVYAINQWMQNNHI